MPKFFLVGALLGAATLGASAQAAIVIDGNPSDWTAADRLDTSPAMQVSGYKLSGRYENNTYKFLLQSATTPIGPNSTIWINTDQSSATGYKIWGWAGGEEFSVNVASDSTLDLYKYPTVNGAPTETLAGKIPATDYKFAGNATTGYVLEFQIPETSLVLPPQTTPPSGAGINLYLDVNNAVFLPSAYASGEYVLPRTALPVAAKNGRRVGIVYSATSASRFWDAKGYSQLFMGAQAQAMQAGIPFDLLTENDLTDLTKVIKYDTLVFPYFANVAASNRAAIEQNLTTATTKYNVGLVAAGNFMTNDETGAALPGDTYSRMKNLLGITRVNGAGPVSALVNVINATHPMLQGSYAANENVLNYSATYTDYFDAAGTAGYTVTPILNQVLNGAGSYNAVLASTNASGARNVHFGSVQYMGDANLLWPALQWSVYGGKAPATLQMGRQASVFAARNDMDEAMYPSEISTVETPLLALLTQWKNSYNFVGSYYLDVGDDPTGTIHGNGPETTNWAISGPLYKKYLALGNEIGDHSYSHPPDTNVLTAAQTQHEFGGSITEIQQNMGLANIGAAVPGAPDLMPAATEMLKYPSYLTGGYSGVGAGFPNAMGYLTPADTKVYLSPNMTFDYTNIEFQQKTPAQTETEWASEFDGLNRHANQAVIHWPWHDYGPTIGTATNWGGTRSDGTSINYTVAMYADLIAKAFNAGTEFITGSDLSKRIASFRNSALTVTQPDAATLNVNLTSADAGRFAITTNAAIASVDNWYAYNTQKIFPATTGGAYTVHLGATPAAATHISKLPMRANLLYARLNAGNPKELDFSFEGQGAAEVTLKCSTGTRAVTGANSSSFNSSTNVLTLNFTTPQTQVASVATTCP